MDTKQERKKHKAWMSWVDFIRKNPTHPKFKKLWNFNIEEFTHQSNVNMSVLNIIDLKLHELNIFLEAIYPFCEDEDTRKFIETSLTRVARRKKELEKIIEKNEKRRN